ncbi:MAG: hypothetical protein JOZ47_09045 [Kutzneria sp.]|nr:hypothetical protein [Kutzneria sp.]
MRDIPRRLVFACALPAVALVALAGDHPFPTLAGPPADAPRAIVALGDSTASGEGAGSYLPGTDGEHDDWCHRSPNAMIDHVSVPGVTKIINLACSGAGADRLTLDGTAHSAEPSQASQLAALADKYRVVAVTVAVGANDDPQFSGLIVRCVQAAFDTSQPGCGRQVDGQWPAKIAAMVPKVVQALRDIRTVMSDHGYSDSAYTLVLQSYAAPVGPDTILSLRNLNGCPFRIDDLRWVQDKGVSALSAGLRLAARMAGVRFLDLSQAGIGHEACSGNVEWFTRLTLDLADFENNTRYQHALQESFHPNAKGYTAFGGCMSRFLASTDLSAACVPNGNDGLRLNRTDD